MNKFLKVMEDVTNFIVGSESVVIKEETPMGFTAPKKKRKYTRRKKTSVIPRVTTTSSTGRIRKPSTKYVMGSSMYTSTVAHTQTTHTQVQGRDRGWCGHGEFR